MAQRDRSQGFGFVYLDFAKFLAAKQKVETVAAPSVNFNRDPQSPSPPAPSPATPREIDELRANLDRLQALHHKLHAVLEELSQITKKK